MIPHMKTPDRKLEFMVTWAVSAQGGFQTRDEAKRYIGDKGRVWFKARFWPRWQDCTDDAVWADFEQQMLDFEDELKRKREER